MSRPVLDAAWLLERKYSMQHGKMERKAEEADDAPVQLTLGLVIKLMEDDGDDRRPTSPTS